MKKNPNSCRWSELPMDMLRQVLERLSVLDLHRAKIVCSSWYLCSKQTVRQKSGSPLLMLSPEEGGCVLYNPDEDRVYKTTKSEFSGYRFLGSSGKWFLVVDSRSKLYIIDLFSEERIDLPPLESIKDGLYSVERLGDRVFMVRLVKNYSGVLVQAVEDLRGVLWVDDKSGEYVVVWQFESNGFLGFCKKGDDHYREITTCIGVRRELQGLCHMVLKGYSLYVLTSRKYIRQLDLSGQDGFKDVSEKHSIAVTTSGEALYVRSKAYETSTLERLRTFHVFKRDPKDLDPSTKDTRLVELDSLGDEALFLDLGVTVKADHSLGVEPNSIYFTLGDRIHHNKVPCMDICVYNHGTKNIKRFHGLSKLNVKDAQWFLPR
ncbi:unnamed protein product [Microthlaspi erraticum]|uniref:F-box domain-containing protein n=1 Tax=Microthlaspi erraticum TaxID=1685480 RepID=A0A6D2I6J3_9BRAS|nr:unnamed protein product [Microthlaspi erraticum]